MRREEIIQAANNVRMAVEDSGAIRIVSGPTRAERNFDELLQSYSSYMIAHNSFGDAEKAVISALKLAPLSNASFWKEATTPSTTGRTDASVFAVRRGMMMLVEYVPSFLHLLHREELAREIVLEDSASKTSKTIEAANLVLYIREPGAPSLTVRQFSDILQAIDSLYSAIVKIHSLESSELVVGPIDSGSDKSFDIVGIATAISKLSELFVQCWDRVRYSKQMKVSATIKSAGDGIKLLESISSAVEKKAIGPEEAEKLRRTVMKSIEDLFSNGVYTPQMENQSAVRPSQLPVERRKMIAHYSAEAIPKNKVNPESEDQDDIEI